MIFIDATAVVVRDCRVMSEPLYVVIGVSTSGEWDMWGSGAGVGGQGAEIWLAGLTEIKNRGFEDVCIAVRDGMKGLPDAITTTWELAQAQTIVIDLIRNTS